MKKPEDYGYFYARRYAYDLLRRLFLEEPTVELLSWLQQEDNLTLFPNVENSVALSNALKEMNDSLAGHTFSEDEAGFDDIHWDFTRLFIGPEAPPAPPWESVYVSRDKLLFQQSTLDVKQFYEKHGFELEGSEREAADHIGFELDFLYHLSEQSAGLLEKDGIDSVNFMESLRTQKTFLQRHPLAFIDAFSRNVYNHAETPFYRALSTVLQQFLQQDERQLGLYLKD